MKLSRVVAAVAIASALACSDSLLGPSVSTDRAALFDDLWGQFDLHYSFFELKQVDWNLMRERYRPQALAAHSDAEFAGVLGAMLAELRDVHVTITPSGPQRTLRYISPRENVSTYFDSRIPFERYVTSAPRSTTGRVRYGMLTDSVGYLYIASFDDAHADSELDAAIKALVASGARSMIVDVRNNLGGRYEMARAMAGRFADRERVFGYLRRRNGAAHDDFTGYTAETIAPTGSARFAGPVFVLANRRSLSSAETFVLAMRALPGVITVGDTTAGASGGPIVRELANGWTYQLSEWIDYTATKHVYEEVGLPPDVAVAATAADLTRAVDAVLERALALAHALPSAPPRP